MAYWVLSCGVPYWAERRERVSSLGEGRDLLWRVAAVTVSASRAALVSELGLLPLGQRTLDSHPGKPLNGESTLTRCH